MLLWRECFYGAIWSWILFLLLFTLAIRILSSVKPATSLIQLSVTHLPAICSPSCPATVDTAQFQRLPSRIPIPAQHIQHQSYEHDSIDSEKDIGSLVDLVFQNDNLCERILNQFLRSLHQQCPDLCWKKDFALFCGKVQCSTQRE